MWRYTNETAWISSSEWGLIHKTSGLRWSDFSATESSFPDGAQTWHRF